MAPVIAILDEISIPFSTMDNALLHESGQSPEDKIEWRIALIHAHSYLAELDDKRDEKSAAANIFDISCGGGGSSSPLSVITISISDTYDVFCCLIFTSSRFLLNDPLSIDDMVDWDNDVMLIIWGGDTNIDEGSFVLHNLW